MGYSIRPLATLGLQARAFFVQAVPGALVRLWANTFTVLGKVMALMDFEAEQRRQWLFRQLFASTADELWLIRHGFELGLTPDAGSAAFGLVNVGSAAGDVIPAGAQFARLDGATYSLLAPVTPTGASVNLILQADAVGAAFNVEAGDILTLVPSTLVPDTLGATATVGGNGIAGGVDAEGLETFRQRVLFRKRNPPQGGSTADYTEWAGQALGTVRSVFVDSFVNDSRSVWLCFTVADQPVGIPTPQQVAIVQTFASDPIRRPITARVFATGPTPVPVPIALTNFAPDSEDTRAAVAAEIAALQLDAIRPSTPSEAFTLYVEEIEAAINRATGVTRFTLVSPAADVFFATPGQMPVLQPPTYS